MFILTVMVLTTFSGDFVSVKVIINTAVLISVFVFIIRLG